MCLSNTDLRLPCGGRVAACEGILWPQRVGSRCGGFSGCRAQAGSAGPSVVAAPGLSSTGLVTVHGPSCSTARGIFLDQGLKQCPLHYQADS